MITPQHIKLHIMKLTTSYWYNPKNKITIRIPLEDTWHDYDWENKAIKKQMS